MHLRFPRESYTSCPAHNSWFYHSNNIKWRLLTANNLDYENGYPLDTHTLQEENIHFPCMRSWCIQGHYLFALQYICFVTCLVSWANSNEHQWKSSHHIILLFMKLRNNDLQAVPWQLNYSLFITKKQHVKFTSAVTKPVFHILL
jgi:hypothetical protein